MRTNSDKQLQRADVHMNRQEGMLQLQMDESAQVPNSRMQLVESVFRLCDTGGDGRLTEEKLRIFAQRTGFDGSRDEWAKEYAQLCTDRGLSAAEGLRFEDFVRLLEDDVDTGQYFTDAELEDFVKHVPIVFAESKRASLQPQASSSNAIGFEERPKLAAGKPKEESVASKTSVQPSVASGPPPWLPLKHAPPATGDRVCNHQER